MHRLRMTLINRDVFVVARITTGVIIIDSKLKKACSTSSQQLTNGF